MTTGPAKMAKAIKMPFRLQTPVTSRNNVSATGAYWCTLAPLTNMTVHSPVPGMVQQRIPVSQRVQMQHIIGS